MTAFSCRKFASCPNLKEREAAIREFSENGGRKNSAAPSCRAQSYYDSVAGFAGIYHLLIFILNAGLTAISLSLTGKPYTRRVPLR